MKLKLFYILHAGGFATSINPLLPYFSENDVEVIAIEYAGRGIRSNESRYKSFNEMVQDIFKKIIEQVNHTPYIIWGHSMGAIVAYEICHMLNGMGNELLQYAVFSGQDAPSKRYEGNKYHSLSKLERVEFISQFGGIPNDIIEVPAWFEFFLSYIEADLFLMDEYEYVNRGKLKYKCLIIQGKEDKSINSSCQDWEELFYEINYKVYDGGHFFLFDESKIVMQDINDIVKELLKE